MQAMISRVPNERRRLLLGLALVLLIGVMLVPEYGQSTDEYSNYLYAANALRAYTGTRSFTGPFFEGNPIDWLYGPFHLEVALVLGAVTQRPPLGWTPTDGRHLVNFVVFLLGAAGLYSLCRRNTSPIVSGVITALYISQPLLWGQAFVNAKDTPFLSYFILSVAIGLAASDRLAWPEPPTDSGASELGLRKAVAQDLKSNGGLVGWVLVSFWGLVAIILICLLLAWIFLPLAAGILAEAYAGAAMAPVQTVFDLVATDAYKTPLALYLNKLDLIYAWAKIPLAAILLAAAWRLTRKCLAQTMKAIARLGPRGVLWMAGAGVLLGLADSIRVAAPLAGILVAGYVLARWGLRAWLPLSVYALAAVVVTYLTWPWLWTSPVAHYLESLKVMSNFPSHNVLFGGKVYASVDIPWDYAPRLIAIQTTEVIVPLFIVGLVVWWARARRKVAAAQDLVLWMAWLVIPLTLVIGLGTPLYGNLRQMLFVLPPLFLVGGMAIEAAFQRLRSPTGRVSLCAGLLLPGLLGITLLHPYEDSYFNAWVGWTSGAYGQYQVDPWCTAYREATQQLDALASSGAKVNVRGPFQSAQDFARADLDMHPDFAPVEDPDFALMCQIDILGDGFQSDLPIAYRVTRGRAVLAVLRGPR